MHWLRGGWLTPIPLLVLPLRKGENLEKKYVIPLAPIPWKSRGVNCKGDKPKFYDTQLHTKNAYALYIAQQHGSSPLFEGPLQMDVIYYISYPPGSVLRIRKDQIGPIPYHYRRPDVDNLNNLLYDACKSILFNDDCLISKESTTKLYDSKPRIEITLRNLW